jgi:molecular chaperone GrpE
MQSSRGADPRELDRDELVEELERARSDIAASEERVLRARADLENYRKRTDRELERRVREQGDDLLRAWLEVVDSLDRAVALDAEHPELAAGVRAFLDQVETLLMRQGVSRIGAVGEAFDPELHEAVAIVPAGGGEDGTVARVARSGYAARDRVIRPAQVAVAQTRDDG